MANSFTPTQFISRALGTFVVNNSFFHKYAYRGINEFGNGPGGFAPGRTIGIKIPGVPTTQLGLATTAEDVQDREIPYTLEEIDIYNVTRAIDFQSIGLEVVGGKAAFSANKFDERNQQELNPQARTLIDNYVTPAGRTILATIETVIAEKLKKAAWYCPYSLPTDMQAVNSFSDISSTKTWMDQLGFQMMQRCIFMNNRDYQGVADSLQNMFNRVINDGVTSTGNYMEDKLSGFTFKACNTIAPTEESPQYAANTDSTGVTVSSVGAGGATITLAGVISTTNLVLNAGTLVSLPTVKPINQNTKLTYENTLVVVVTEDANGDGAGNVTFTVSEPLVAVGEQSNVDSLPGGSDIALIWPAHQNNYPIIPMGIVSNSLPLGDIVSADQATYRKENVVITSYIQGVVSSGVNTYRLSCQNPTLAIPHYVMNLPSPI